MTAKELDAVDPEEWLTAFQDLALLSFASSTTHCCEGPTKGCVAGVEDGEVGGGEAALAET